MQNWLKSNMTSTNEFILKFYQLKANPHLG